MILRFALVVLMASGSAIVDAAETRVMSFNIRYGTAKDGDNHWDRRKDLVLETIQRFDPDLLGTQETLAFQRDYLRDRLPGYLCIGVGRDDAAESGEMMAIFVREARYEVLDSGHVWLSETPNVPGSKSWGSSITRMCTWARLRDLRQPQGPDVFFVNTHLDHQSADARREQARVLRKTVDRRAQGARVVVTGDFNTPPDSEPYQQLFVASPKATVLIDTYRAVAGNLPVNEGTFSGFDPATIGGARIDWIGVRGDWTVRSASIVRYPKDGRLPSDHFPVVAILGQ